MTRRRDDRGTALVEFVWLAILLLVPLLYVVLAVFETQRAAYAASAAARSATRAFVTAPDERSAYSRAEAAARGLRLVTSPLPAFREILPAAVLASSSDPGALAAKVLEVEQIAQDELVALYAPTLARLSEQRFVERFCELSQ